MSTAVRVRYAPSPTGIPHVGNIRTALFNWLFARHMGGSFIVRIEDTDQARKVDGAVEAILESLAWLGIDWDEGPERDGCGERGAYGSYFQSRRKEEGLYDRYARQLVNGGHAYVCDCTTERLDSMREAQRAAGQPPGYDRRCRNLAAQARAAQAANGSPKVVRFKVPESGDTSFHDLIRDEVSFQNDLLDDFVLLKSDGFPTYHLANVVDDHLMEVTHVMRAEEWLSSTPRHVLLYDAFGWTPPLFAHLPMILGSDRSKLSKRHGATSLLEYRDEGFLPEAMLNFLALLGWSLDDKTEKFTSDELIKHFAIERIGKTGAIFNKEKLEWFNGVYVRQMPATGLARRMTPFLEGKGGLPADVSRPIDQAYLSRIVPLVQERVKRLDEAAELTGFFFSDGIAPQAADLVQKGMDGAATRGALEAALARMEALAAWDAPALEQALRALAGELQVKTGQLFGALRFAATGSKATPPLFDTLAVLGRERVLRRVRRAAQALAA
ncbi:MAG: glutamate--tRNA ligase [Dehalococcoidia bacterium]|nr:glutamate--tRNA ligase [Dehalococcoidia bacterium]